MVDVGWIVEPTSSLAWVDVICADFQMVISRHIQNISTCLSCKIQRGLRTIFIKKKVHAEICMSYYQIWRGLNRPILRPLWLMTSAAADVISVPSVMISPYVDVPICSYAYAGNKSATFVYNSHLLNCSSFKCHLCKIIYKNHDTKSMPHLFVKVNVIWVKFRILLSNKPTASIIRWPNLT